MKIIKSTWNYFFWLGPILTIIGVSAGFVSGTWQPIPLALITAAIIITSLWIFYQAYSREQNPNITWWSGRATEAGTNAIFATIYVNLYKISCNNNGPGFDNCETKQMSFQTLTPW